MEGSYGIMGLEFWAWCTCTESSTRIPQETLHNAVWQPLLTSARPTLPPTRAAPPAVLRAAERCCRTACRAAESAGLRALACNRTAGFKQVASHSSHLLVAASHAKPAVTSRRRGGRKETSGMHERGTADEIVQ
eukprot:830596-Pelagomonas_calceolata.AAC.3